jgi:DNA replication and repair protein RecF
MSVDQLWLNDYRSYSQLELCFPPGVTAILGPNGQGKTNILEAIGWLATMSSFRGAPTDALVRDGASSAIVRARIDADGREALIEAELAPGGRNRVQVNRNRLRRARDLLGSLRVTVFAPDDLDLVKGGPAGRRVLLDDALVSVQPRADRIRTDYERVLRHRNALLRQCAGRLTPEIAATLDVWDSKLTTAGEQLGAARSALVDALRPVVRDAYVALAPDVAEVSLDYDAPWRHDGLAIALTAARRDEVRRGVTLVGPHRDDLVLRIDAMPARTHRSQGEQRSLALALRLAVHRHVMAVTATTPVLLLDDVFSELDAGRSAALLASLPAGQTLLTSATGLPPLAAPDLVVDVTAGTAATRPR